MQICAFSFWVEVRSWFTFLVISLNLAVLEALSEPLLKLLHQLLVAPLRVGQEAGQVAVLVPLGVRHQLGVRAVYNNPVTSISALPWR